MTDSDEKANGGKVDNLEDISLNELFIRATSTLIKTIQTPTVYYASQCHTILTFTQQLVTKSSSDNSTKRPSAPHLPRESSPPINYGESDAMASAIQTILDASSFQRDYFNRPVSSGEQPGSNSQSTTAPAAFIQDNETAGSLSMAHESHSSIETPRSWPKKALSFHDALTAGQNRTPDA
ncbi:hypothetical protein M231_04474 [Tremella mesenterica]|uniref:Uncharacterized protein n=1 Tax=Tremella mesenterica TaxID=5217 RepID=A0A4Q1BKJ3_TREME|nr:hypothetical protein M231_04474 [Tremella mesenterica]